jgi:hypothetical protein
MDQIDELVSEKHVLEEQLFVYKKDLEKASSELRMAQEQLKFYEQQKRSSLRGSSDSRHRGSVVDFNQRKAPVTPVAMNFPGLPTISSSHSSSSNMHSPSIAISSAQNMTIFDYQVMYFNDLTQDGIKGSIELSNERFILVRARFV